MNVFVEKNRSIANSQDLVIIKIKTWKKGDTLTLSVSRKPHALIAKMKQKCPEFRSKKSGGSAGVVSFGGGRKLFVRRYAPAAIESRSMSDKQIKSLLKNAKRGLR